MSNQAIIWLVFLLLQCLTVSGQYELSTIPKELLSRANATIRDDHRTFHLKKPGELIETGFRAITIHNSAGEEYRDIYFYYNKASKIKKIKGELLDSQGNRIGKFDLKDFRDLSASDETSMFSDSRVKHHAPRSPSYPYTIYYAYEIHHQQSLAIPIWRPNYAANVSVEKSSYRMITKPDVELRINSKNLSVEPTVEEADKVKIYQWNVENLSASRLEPFSPSRKELSISVEIVPLEFEYYKKKGEASDWASFGLWVNQALLKDKKTLPESTRQQILKLTEDHSTGKEKAKAIYDFLQNKTRYISIQIGLGGLEPVPAQDVDQLGYGDCKGLVNYMQALLDIVDIPSYYCVVEAGSQKMDVDPEFANITDGNHIILCLPFPNDTTWLECTNQTIPFGYLGRFTDDRLVLACTEEGGKIMRTPTYRYSDNLQHRKAHMILDRQGKLTGRIETYFAGAQFENHYENIDRSKLAQIKWLGQRYDINRINFNQVQYQLEKSQTPSLTESLEIDIENFSIINSDNMTIYPNFMNRSSAIPNLRSRNQIVQINRGYTDIDETWIELPDNVLPLITPFDRTLVVPMGHYQFRVSLENGQLKCYRKLEIREGQYPASSYEKLSNFMREIALTDGLKYNLILR
ncbi:MAG: DUF3857 domain-containing protein [Sphingobacterium sp.]